MAGRQRIAVVTGATGAIGQAIAGRMLAIPEYDLFVIGRNPTKVSRLVTLLNQGTNGKRVRGRVVDVSSHESVWAFARDFEGPVDVLVNNAAVAPPERRETQAGIELVFATNVLGYSWMTEALLPALRMGVNPRVVNVASYWAGDLELDDLEFKRRHYDNDTAYRQSKQANRMLTVAWARRTENDGIRVNCCHPGDVNSRLSNDLGFGGSESPEQGAATPVWLATSQDVDSSSGHYYEHQQKVECRFAHDESRIQRLAEICERYTQGVVA